MATRIISSAFFREGRRGISDALFAANLAADRAGETAPVARRRFSAAAGDIARHGADRAAATAPGLARASWRSLRGQQTPARAACYIASSEWSAMSWRPPQAGRPRM